ncbi:unnamed protein product [Xylocopa violacea]|uniref:Chitin-binding type-4 domain-containing protein n=1 Tax=Xylocopa violacea TaxID=135666 RepID=A0ABP1PG84_XYLVO
MLLTTLLLSAIFSSLIDYNKCAVLSSTSIHGNNEVLPEFTSNNINEPNRVEDKIDYSRNVEDIKVTTSAILTKPASRAYNCFLKNNFNCNIFKSKNSTGAIIGSADFKEKEPKDGQIASTGNPFYRVLDEHRAGRWNSTHLQIKKYNSTHFVTEVTWMFNKKTLTVKNVKVFLSNSNYTDDQPIQRSLLNLVCSYSNNHMSVENYVLRLNCYIRNKFIKDLFYGARASGILLSTVKIAKTDYAFYQVADISLLGSIKQIVTYHGYVFYPLSRAKLCQLRVNKNCGLIIYEPQSVEGFKGFPYSKFSPPDGKIASGNKAEFMELDEYGVDRWTRVKFPEVNCHNRTHLSFNLTCPAEPLSRHHLDLNPICTIKFHGEFPRSQQTMSCPISLEKYRQLGKLKYLLMLSVWNIYDTSNAFYQVIDLQGLSAEQTYENMLRKCL